MDKARLLEVLQSLWISPVSCWKRFARGSTPKCWKGKDRLCVAKAAEAMGSRLRKRSLRPSDSGTPLEEPPPKKKSKKLGNLMEEPEKLKKKKSGKNTTKYSTLAKKGKCLDSTPPSDISNDRCFLVSLNMQEHALRVHKADRTNKGSRKGRVYQRSQSVEVSSDFGNGCSNGSASGGGPNVQNFKNPDFKVNSKLNISNRKWMIFRLSPPEFLCLCDLCCV